MQGAGKQGLVHGGHLQGLGRLIVPDHQQPVGGQALPQHLGLTVVRHVDAKRKAVLDEHTHTRIWKKQKVVDKRFRLIV